MQKLELKQLAAYLPYNITAICNNTGRKTEIINGVNEINGTLILNGKMDNGFPINGDGYKILLRPLSDLTIEWVENNIIECDYIIKDQDIEDIMSIPRGHLMYYQFDYLMKHHFDFWGLIESGLAININDLNK